MTTVHESVQFQSLENPSRPLLDIPSFALSERRQENANNHPTAPSAYFQISPAPASEEASEVETREPLKEVTKGKKGNQEVPEQEQKDDQEETGETSEKLNDYVAKVLEKLVNQRKKINKMNASIDQKTPLIEKTNVPDLDDSVHENADEEEVDNDDGASKENCSPTAKAKPAPTQDLKALLANVVAQQPSTEYNFEDVLQISRKEINYGIRFPGQIVEEHLDIINHSNKNFVVQIIVSCLNEELLDTDEYVFSVRRSHLTDYNDKHFLIMAPNSSASFKFALKVPNLRLSGKILGDVKISIQGVSGGRSINLSADVSIPKVFCPKELKCSGVDYPVIKLAVKEGKKSELKIPLRNNGDVPVTLELEFHDPKDCGTERPLYDIMVHPSVVTISPNSTTLTNIIVKPWRVARGSEKPKPSRKVLVGRVRDSALIYSFVFWVEIY